MAYLRKFLFIEVSKGGRVPWLKAEKNIQVEETV